MGDRGWGAIVQSETARLWSFMRYIKVKWPDSRCRRVVGVKALPDTRPGS